MTRKITPELVKAEGALTRLEKARALSEDLHRSRWEKRRHELIQSFSDDVTDGLVALKIISGEDVQAAAEFAMGGP